MKLGTWILLSKFGYEFQQDVDLELEQDEQNQWRAYLDGHRMTQADFLQRVGPNSIDVTLGNTLLVPQVGSDTVLDLNDPEPIEWEEVSCVDGYTLNPGSFCLGFTRERFSTISPILLSGAPSKRYFAQFYEGRSTMGRIGLGSHITAGFGDYGFAGAFTLELYNHFPCPIVLYHKLRIGQVSFEEVRSPGTYAGSYSGLNHFTGPVGPCLQRRKLFYEE